MVGKPSPSAAVSQQTCPFRLASSLPPVPAKLVKKTQALKLIEMRELLPDNFALAEKLEAIPLHQGHLSDQPQQREIGSLLSWVSYFATYIVVMSAAHPSRVIDMLGYMRLVIREAHKHGGNGWLTYDAVFHCNQEGQDNPWNILDLSLHSLHYRPELPPSGPL